MKAVWTRLHAIPDASLVDARLRAERPDAVASKHTSTARTPTGVMGWTAATQLANSYYYAMLSMPQLSENLKITDIFRQHNNWRLTYTC